MSSVHTKESSNASSNMVSCDSSLDFSLLVKEYTGLITFVNKIPPPGNHELSHFLFPFYVYIYIFLLKNQKFKEAQRFISMYSKLFSKAEGYAEIVQDLVNFKALEDFQDHPYLKNFCASANTYKVKLSEDNLKLFNEYLEGSKCWIISHILHRKFNIEVTEDQTNRERTIESSPIKKKESTNQRTERFENNSSTRSRDVKKSNNAIEGQSNHEHTTETSCINETEPNSLRTEIAENHLSTKSTDVIKANTAVKGQSNCKHTTQTCSFQKKESTSLRTEISDSNLHPKSIDLKKINNVIEGQSNHQYTTETSSIKKKESTSLRTEIYDSNSQTRSIVIKKTNNDIEDQRNHEHTTEVPSIKKKESTNSRNEILESNLQTGSIDVQSNRGHTTEVSFSDKKESSCQRTEITETNSRIRKIAVAKTKNRFSSEVPCYHYTISCRKEELCCVEINQQNTLLACGFESSGIQVWNIDPNIVNKSMSKILDSKESKCSATNLTDDNASLPSLRCVLKQHSGGVYGLDYASGLLISCSEDTTARAWSMTNFKDVRAYCDHKYPIWDVTVSSDCAYFATASLDCTARLWSFNRTIPLRIFVGHSSDVDHVRFHSNGRYLATASADKTVQLWAIEGGLSMRKFPGHDTHINSIEFSSDGKYIASADDSGHIKIWDLASGKLYSDIVAHSKKILSLSYNTDSSLIASCGIDSFIRVWDIKHSLPIDEKGQSEIQASSLIDSHSVDSVPHYISFRQKDVLISVGAKMTT